MKRAAVIVCAVLSLAACGGGGKSPEDQVKQAYVSFFDPTAPFEDHAAFIEGGDNPDSPMQVVHFSSIEPVIVSNVTLLGPSRAKVTFEVDYALYHAPRTGYAVLQDGQWKVTKDTVCGLIKSWGSHWPSCTS